MNTCRTELGFENSEPGQAIPSPTVRRTSLMDQLRSVGAKKVIIASMAMTLTLNSLHSGAAADETVGEHPDIIDPNDEAEASVEEGATEDGVGATDGAEQPSFAEEAIRVEPPEESFTKTEIDPLEELATTEVDDEQNEYFSNDTTGDEDQTDPGDATDTDDEREKGEGAESDDDDETTEVLDPEETELLDESFSFGKGCTTADTGFYEISATNNSDSAPLVLAPFPHGGPSKGTQEYEDSIKPIEYTVEPGKTKLVMLDVVKE